MAITTNTTIGWDRGTFAVERRCSCSRGRRGAECATYGWHVVSSSDDRGDAIGEAGRLRRATDVAHRVVDTRTGEVL